MPPSSIITRWARIDLRTFVTGLRGSSLIMERVVPLGYAFEITVIFETKTIPLISKRQKAIQLIRILTPIALATI
jgi:hypothetical protein